MLLVVDVGNTQTVLGVYAGDALGDAAEPSPSEAGGTGEGRLALEGFKGSLAGWHRVPEGFERPLASWRLATCKHDTADDIRVKVMPLMRMAHIDVNAIDTAVLASVVPALTHEWAQAMAGRGPAKVDVRVCTAATAMEAGLFATDYPNPTEIGADRVADAVAARSLFGAPCVVVDFGTATNIEVIGSDGRFLGGIIAPGVETGASALFSHATRLAATAMEAPPQVIGTSTDTAMQSGIVLGEAARVDGLVARIFEQIGARGPVVATGGLASLVAEHSGEITDVLPELTLEGLRLIARSQ